MKNFNCLNKLKINSFFSLIDIFFANSFNPESEQEAFFLAYLFLISRKGFITLIVEKDDIYPKPKDLNIEEINDEVLIKKIIDGEKKISNASYIEKSFENFPEHPIVKYKNYYYLQKNFVFETFILKNLNRLLLKKTDEFFYKEKFFEILKNEKTLFVDQKQAIKNAYEKTISFIIGGPGSGKTYLAAHLINNFYLAFNNNNKNEFKIVATAFTGKATSHFKKMISKNFQNINIEVKTLHLLLDIKERKNKYFGKEKLDYDLIIVDEASMIDIRLFSYLLDSIKDKTRIIFIGDPNQLPPIEGGNIFSELIKENFITTTYLKKAIRFENDIILSIADSIKEEDMQNFVQLLEKIKFTDLNNYENTKKTLFEEAKNYFFNFSDKKLDMDELLEKTSKFRILTSMKKGLLGVDIINKEIFSYFYKQIKSNQFLYIPIMITKNQYQLNLFNGDLGILEYQILNGELTEGKAFFKIDEKIKNYSIYSIRSYEYAFAISIHKSQGSEFESAILIISECTQNFGKELLYTGLTRVKKKVHIISTKNYLIKMLKKSTLKKSGFCQRLKFENFDKNLLI